MKKVITLILCAASASLATAGCTDTTVAHWQALGSAARITCFSGGKLISDDFSTGKVKNAGSSDGYEYKSVTTHRLEQVSGDCVVDYGASPQPGWKATLP